MQDVPDAEGAVNRIRSRKQRLAKAALEQVQGSKNGFGRGRSQPKGHPRPRRSYESRGSLNHFRGHCRPCVPFAQGYCAAGTACNFCHEKHDESDLQVPATMSAVMAENSRSHSGFSHSSQSGSSFWSGSTYWSGGGDTSGEGYYGWSDMSGAGLGSEGAWRPGYQDLAQDFADAFRQNQQSACGGYPMPQLPKAPGLEDPDQDQGYIPTEGRVKDARPPDSDGADSFDAEKVLGFLYDSSESVSSSHDSTKQLEETEKRPSADSELNSKLSL